MSIVSQESVSTQFTQNGYSHRIRLHILLTALELGFNWREDLWRVFSNPRLQLPHPVNSMCITGSFKKADIDRFIDCYLQRGYLNNDSRKTKFSLSEKGKDHLSKKGPLDEYYLEIIRSTEKEIDAMVRYDKEHVLPIPFADSPLFSKYFEPDGRKLKPELHESFQYRYLAQIIDSNTRQLLWIGTFGEVPEKKGSFVCTH
jgi:hypothetical protein